MILVKLMFLMMIDMNVDMIDMMKIVVIKMVIVLVER